MPWELAPAVSWTVRHRGGAPRHAGDLARALRDLMAAHFPGSAGYELEALRLSGPMAGSVIRVTRGDFRARVTLQIYCRGQRTDTDTHELRLIGSIGSGRVERARRIESRWDILGRGVGLGLGALTLAGAAWALAALLGNSLLAPGSPMWVASILPAGLLGWMGGAAACASLTRRGRLALVVALRHVSDDVRFASALRAWGRAIPALTGLRELAVSDAHARPFRALAPAQ